jgi:hypothetical protein
MNRNDFVTVLESDRAGRIAMARSLLDETEIPYVVDEEALLNMYGVGCAKVRVHPRDAEVARELLRHLL